MPTPSHHSSAVSVAPHSEKSCRCDSNSAVSLSRIVPSKSNTTLNMDTEEQVSSASYSHAALFPHELLDVVGPAAAASGRAAGFPARKRVDPRPCSRRRARAAVDVHDAGVHVGEEAFDLVLVLGEESRRQAVIGAVGQLDGL